MTDDNLSILAAIERGKITLEAAKLAPPLFSFGGPGHTIEQWLLFDDLVSSLEETLAVAMRNETGGFADRARALLSKIKGAA